MSKPIVEWLEDVIINCKVMQSMITNFESLGTLKIQFADPLNKRLVIGQTESDPRKIANSARVILESMGMNPTDWMAVPKGSMYSWEIHAQGYVFCIEYIAGTPIPINLQ